MKIIDNTIYASEGMLLRRKSDGAVFGSRRQIGYTAYMFGARLPYGRREKASDYEEVSPALLEKEELAAQLAHQLECERDDVLRRIEIYGIEGVNFFFVNNSPCWLDKAARVGLRNSLAVERRAGRADTLLILGDNTHTVSIEVAELLLDTVELYALECRRNTDALLREAASIDDVKLLQSFPVSKGYPLPPSFSIAPDGSLSVL